MLPLVYTQRVAFRKEKENPAEGGVCSNDTSTSCFPERERHDVQLTVSSTLSDPRPDAARRQALINAPSVRLSVITAKP